VRVCRGISLIFLAVYVERSDVVSDVLWAGRMFGRMHEARCIVSGCENGAGIKGDPKWAMVFNCDDSNDKESRKCEDGEAEKRIPCVPVIYASVQPTYVGILNHGLELFARAGANDPTNTEFWNLFHH
jgi:hypothetical protein